MGWLSITYTSIENAIIAVWIIISITDIVPPLILCGMILNDVSLF
jgi:hypothetical protein